MYAVIDTETTGLSPDNDRIIELAIVGLDRNGSKEWEWCSLINPGKGRNTGTGLAVRVHQIYPRDVEGAPEFADFSGQIANLLSGRAIIGHNVSFDIQMLVAEFNRIRVRTPDLIHLCTASIARNAGIRPCTLEACCEAYGIPIEGAHHALADARSTAQLAANIIEFGEQSFQSAFEQHLADCIWPTLSKGTVEPVQRPIVPVRRKSPAKSHPRAPTSAVPPIEACSIDLGSPAARYLAAIEWALEDREISADQKTALQNLQRELGLTEEQVRDVHMQFFRGLVGSMWADGVISAHEEFDLGVVAHALSFSKADIEYAKAHPIGLDLINDDYKLSPGAKVVFTGEMSLSRGEWTERATSAGLKVTGSVSGKTDYLVVPFGETGSGKSRKAREKGVRVVSEQRFRRMIENLERSSLPLVES